LSEGIDNTGRSFVLDSSRSVCSETLWLHFLSVDSNVGGVVRISGVLTLHTPEVDGLCQTGEDDNDLNVRGG
jgi:hypothetical protein